MEKPTISAPYLICISTYNERENLPPLVEAIFTQLPDAHLLIVDDNSPDGTGVWCDERAAGDSRLKCLHRAGKLGLGTATLDGLRYGLQHGYPVLATMDADFSHDPKFLPAMLQRLDDNDASMVDVVVGSRYVPGGGIEGWPLQRRLMSRGINGFARWWLGLTVNDTSGAFRVYRADILRKFDLNAVRSRGYSVFEELLWWLQRADARFAEVPIVFVDRHRGQSKITWSEAIRSLWRIVQVRYG
ncbi:MAG: polyprenol monophosphomannose synthase [Planctomycetales bacterium]|nr:polyprenol monophosphomannose synthase [Planctomycetales bacterium]